MTDLSSLSAIFYNLGQSGNITVNIGANVTRIPAYLFDGVTKIVSINFARGSVCQIIGNFAFSNCGRLAGINIPLGVETIGNSSFYRCYALSGKIILGATTIGDSAFYLCENITGVTLSHTVTIGSFAFQGCRNLFQITLPDSLINIGHSTFSGCSSFTDIVIPAKVETIGNSAFSFCSGLTYITLPDSLYAIGNSAFYYCNILSITIPANVSVVGDNAFYYCANLYEVTILGSLTYMGSYAFYGCDRLATVNFYAEEMADLQANNNAFYCETIVSEITLNIGSDVKRIPAYLFENIQMLTAVNFAWNSVCEYIGDYAFYGCDRLPGFDMPASLKSIGDCAFYGCYRLENIDLKNVISVGNYSFYACNDLTGLIIPASLINIGDCAFSFCIGLENISVQSGNPVFWSQENCVMEGDTVILGCSGSVIPPDVNIGNYAFCGSGLVSLVIPAGASNIGYHAFDGCSFLVRISVENGNPVYYGDGNCLLQGNTVILGCSSSILPNYVTQIGDYAFSYTGIENIIIPSGVTRIGNFAFYKSALRRISTPSSLTIGNNAFDGCHRLDMNAEFSNSYSVWDGSVSLWISGGGTVDDPYRISSGEELSYLCSRTGILYNQNYILTNDIYLNDISDWQSWSIAAPANSWTPIGTLDYPFSGSINGNGYVIRGLYIDTDDSYQGLFGYMSNASVFNLGIEQSFIRGGDYVGSIVGYADFRCAIINNYNASTVIGGDYVGGIAGYFGVFGTLMNNYNAGLVRGEGYAGGITGYTSVTSDIRYNLSLKSQRFNWDIDIYRFAYIYDYQYSLIKNQHFNDDGKIILQSTQIFTKLNECVDAIRNVTIQAQLPEVCLRWSNDVFPVHVRELV